MRIDGAVSRRGRRGENNRSGDKPWIHGFILTCTETDVRLGFLPYIQTC
jgi:hypothetical protein